MAYTINSYNAYEAAYGYAAWKANFIGSLPRTGSNTSTTASSQQSFPTSAYGQTIPVVYGKARLPGAYIWAPEILVRTTTTGALLTTTTVTVNLSARIRFGRPLVADSRWRLRRLWADGNLILDRSTGYRKSGLTVREYDGYSTQGRDPTMVSKEGTSNVSAHRGYLDIVITNYNLGTAGAPPPSFEAEWVQEASSSVDVDITTGYFVDDVNTYAAGDWDNGRWYGITTGTPNYLRCFDIGANSEIYAVTITGVLVGASIAETGFHYIPDFDRIVISQTIPGISGGVFPGVMDPISGEVLASAGAIGVAGAIANMTAVVSFGNVACLLCSDFSQGYFSTFLVTPDSITRTFISGTSWDSRGLIECFVIGAVRTSDADVYAVAGDTLYKLVVNSTGQVLSITTLYTDADDLHYCVYHDTGVIVWNSNLEVMRVHPTTGAVEWTETVPYQIPATAASRSIAPPDMHRLDGTFMYEVATAYYFTDLDDGSTETTAKSSTTVGKNVYDDIGGVGINTDRTITEIARRVTFDAVGNGSSWLLEDFLTALMVAGGFEEAEVTCEGFADEILGAIIDISGGVRDIARQVCDPYSIAIFERADVIVFKRADTDGSFAVDVTIVSTDVLDRGGQAISATKFNPQEKPAKYGLNYRDPDEVYQARPQWGEIPSLPLPVAVTDIGIKADIPIIIEADTAKVLATKRIYRDHVQVHEFQMTGRAKHLKVEPETIQQFTYAGRTITARVLENTIHPNFTNTISCTEFLTSSAVTISGAVGRPIEPEPVGSALSRYFHLDIPLMEDAHDTAGSSLVQYHVLTSGGQPYWDGATLYRLESSTYIPQATQVENGLVGIALTALPDWDIPYVTELTREITIAIISGDTDLLVSATYQEVCEGANMFAIGQPGRWEVCHVIDITNNGDNTYTFTGLRRGRGTSEEFTGDHEAGDFVVWLGDDNVQRLEYAIAALDDAYDYKPVGFGGSLATTIAVNRTVTGEAEKIPKPCQLDAVLDGADIDLDWVRRSRIGSYWPDDGDDTYTTPLGESVHQYVLRIKDGPGGTVDREVTVSSATAYTYTAADQTTYSGGTFSAGDDFTFDIRQVSGTGVVCPTREITVTL
jgi:hypothetical protein